MLGLSNERHKKLISVGTSAWDLGTIFSKVTICVRRHERNGVTSWSLIGQKNTMPQNLRSTRSKNANGLLNLSVKGTLPGDVPTRLVNFRSHQASTHTDFARFICLSPRLFAPGSPRMYLFVMRTSHWKLFAKFIFFSTRFSAKSRNCRGIKFQQKLITINLYLKWLLIDLKDYLRVKPGEENPRV